jgi:hypothetical protein
MLMGEMTAHQVAIVALSKNCAQKMDPKKMTMGKGAIISVLSSNLHPTVHIQTMWPNPEKNHRVKNLVVLRQEMKKSKSLTLANRGHNHETRGLPSQR